MHLLEKVIFAVVISLCLAQTGVYCVINDKQSRKKRPAFIFMNEIFVIQMYIYYLFIYFVVIFSAKHQMLGLSFRQ